MHEQTTRLEGGAKDDLQYKYATLLAFDYEAAARLKSWESFKAVIEVRRALDSPGYIPSMVITQEAQSLQNPWIYNTLADITLSCDAPSYGEAPYPERVRGL